MFSTLPAVLDARRMVTARRQFDGRLPLSGMPRLRASLMDAEGECEFQLEFGRDATGLDFLEIKAQAQLPLQCQRTLERFLHPVSIVQRLGLITDEAQESALLPEMEPVMLGPEGQLHPAELIEDELILAIPVVPIDPDSTAPDAAASAEPDNKPNPFAALAALKANKS